MRANAGAQQLHPQAPFTIEIKLPDSPVDHCIARPGLARNVLGHDLALDAPMMAAGRDSLGAVELRNAVAEVRDLPLTDSMWTPSPVSCHCSCSDTIAGEGCT